MSSRTAMTLSLIPAPGTLERRLLIDVLAKMARIWIDSQRQERAGQAEEDAIAAGQEQETANGSASTPGPLATSDAQLESQAV
jgi:hypothetical protein